MPQLREIGTWDEAYLETLPTAEFDWLDFKRSAWLAVDDPKWIDRVSHYLSAFANYDGGYLVIGVIDPKTSTKIECDGGVDQSIKNGLKDWVEDKFPTLVDPRLEKISVQEIVGQTSQSSIKPGHCVLAVHVPPSGSAPHQALDRRYYARLGSKLIPLGDRAVQDIAGRAKHPKIEITKLRVCRMGIRDWRLSLTAKNESAILARFAQICIDLPIHLRGELIYEPKEIRTRTDAGVMVARINFHFGALKGPMFPRAPYNLEKGLQTVPKSGDAPWMNVPTIDEVHCRIYADEMPFKDLKFPIDDVIDK